MENNLDWRVFICKGRRMEWLIPPKSICRAEKANVISLNSIEQIITAPRDQKMGPTTGLMKRFTPVKTMNF